MRSYFLRSYPVIVALARSMSALVNLLPTDAGIRSRNDELVHRDIVRLRRSGPSNPVLRRFLELLLVHARSRHEAGFSMPSLSAAAAACSSTSARAVHQWRQRRRRFMQRYDVTTFNGVCPFMLFLKSERFFQVIDTPKLIHAQIFASETS
ncbi:hypothetical protein C8Q80DRAFT_262150 [Daedaleopsis nitida]|nr:hypothetical protein C8Q80DRAFT_262150 [Daedaleopsis nitida]